MYEPPRNRRLRSDLISLERLCSESSVFRFSAEGNPPYRYMITFRGRGIWLNQGYIKPIESHRVEIKLTSSYPRTLPELRWITPIYHPNISEIGMVCLGGYGTHWAPSVQLDELCQMLWDMARYHNYDVRSPYNRDAALWVARQTTHRFPLDERPLRDLRVAMGRIEPGQGPDESSAIGSHPEAGRRASATEVARDLLKRFGRLALGREAPRSSGLADYAQAEQSADIPLHETVIDLRESDFANQGGSERGAALRTSRAQSSSVGDEILFIE